MIVGGKGVWPDAEPAAKKTATIAAAATSFLRDRFMDSPVFGSSRTTVVDRRSRREQEVSTP
jgi:hypothetical protein